MESNKVYRNCHLDVNNVHITNCPSQRLKTISIECKLCLGQWLAVVYAIWSREQRDDILKTTATSLFDLDHTYNILCLYVKNQMVYRLLGGGVALDGTITLPIVCNKVTIMLLFC